MAINDPLGIAFGIATFPYEWPRQSEAYRRPVLMLPDYTRGGSPEQYILCLPFTTKPDQRDYPKFTMWAWESYLKEKSWLGIHPDLLIAVHESCRRASGFNYLDDKGKKIAGGDLKSVGPQMKSLLDSTRNWGWSDISHYTP